MPVELRAMPSRRRLSVVLGVALVAAIGPARAPARAQGVAPPAADLPNPYREIENWGRLPGGRTIGAASAIDIDRDGSSVWVFERCGGKGASKVRPVPTDTCLGSSVAPLLKFDASGTLIASLGAGLFVYPHGMFVDRSGNLWLTDGQAKGGKGLQVVELSPAGKVLLTLGKAGIAGDGPDTFNPPSDVIVGPNGDVFVADGHGGTTNARIVKFARDGKFVKTWGRSGVRPGEFSTPHSLAMDSAGRLFVADRGNARIQVFDQDGRFLAEWKQFGNPSGIYIDRDDRLFSVGTLPNGQRGVSVASARDGKPMFFVPDHDPNPEGYIGGREGIAADRNGNILISRTGPGGLLKLATK
jgi:hypothetical protein